MNIEKYFVLFKYLLNLFGIDDFRDLQEKLRDVSEGVDTDGRSYFINVLKSLENIKISEEDLKRYDINIQSYVKKINYKREPISLKYFQYLAILFTEIVLDNLKNRKREFLNELNQFLEGYKKNNSIEVSPFSEDDLRKLAFYMATGSGKTLIAHINYYQFLNYDLFSPDNILFITPNEGLSKQHFEELQKSGIPCRLYSGSLSGISRNEREILIIEITKFVEEKKGGGVTLPVDMFEGKNLIFVDEGHKGKISEEQKWAKVRSKLAENGFVFEYSATFGQILSEKNKKILEEYAKSIIFDYSYKYFYLDGYGKDFSVLNISTKPGNVEEKKFQELVFVANMLSFYEQLLTYEKIKNEAKVYNFEKPLWIFVGATVVGKKEKTEIEKKEESDVLQVVELIKNAISDKNWLKEKADLILNEKTNIKNEEDRDIFENKFDYLKRQINIKDDNTIEDMYKKIFGGSGSFEVYELKRAEGELGLKVGENNYFGVITIGDVSSFKKKLEEKGITVKQDVVSDSLFDNIKKEGSKISILIGSRKFIEGWDTWRVSSMCLLNIGVGQGPLIIQLFGRGVRLKGKGMTLKRSNDEKVRSLETLNIYGIKAEYLKHFLESIRKEEVEFETIKIKVKPRHEEKWDELYILSKDENKKFEEEILKLEVDKELSIVIDLLPRISEISSTEKREDIISNQTKTGLSKLKFSKNYIDLINWNKIEEEIYNFKVERGYWNLIFNRSDLENILLLSNYEIKASQDIFNKINDASDIDRLEEIALLIIKKYIDSFYRKHAKRFETENLKYAALKEQKPLSIFEQSTGEYSYIVQVNKTEKKLIEDIKKLIEGIDKELENIDKELFKYYNRTLPRIYFDTHLYVPILLQNKKIDRIYPAGLVESEKEFIEGLSGYPKNDKHKYEIYLLRNFPKRGIGFFNLSGFYPDFIMWIKSNEKQIIVFIDPKGLEHTKGLDDEKIQLRTTLKKIEKKLHKNNLVLDSFILSKTPYNELTKGRTNPPSIEEYENNHVLFLENKEWPEKLFKKLFEFFNNSK
jgi:superfamily II DNA or RNA helicase